MHSCPLSDGHKGFSTSSVLQQIPLEQANPATAEDSSVQLVPHVCPETELHNGRGRVGVGVVLGEGDNVSLGVGVEFGDEVEDALAVGVGTTIGGGSEEALGAGERFVENVYLQHLPYEQTYFAAST